MGKRGHDLEQPDLQQKPLHSPETRAEATSLICLFLPSHICQVSEFPTVGSLIGKAVGIRDMSSALYSFQIIHSISYIPQGNRVKQALCFQVEKMKQRGLAQSDTAGYGAPGR